MYKFFFILALLLAVCSFSEAMATPIVLQELPVNPNAKKKKQKLRKRLWGNTQLQKAPKTRTWGVLSAVVGGYLIIFSISAVLILIGFNWYAVILFGLPLIPGIMLMMMGIQLIDQSYFHYSENNKLRQERIRPLIWRDFSFAFILFLIMLPMIWLQFYITAGCILLATAILLIMGFLKWESYKRL